MTNVKIIKPFAYSNDGYTVRDYTPESVDLPPDVASWALENGFGVVEGVDEPPKRTRKPRATNADE